jgi:hypothetical protein
VGHGLRGLGERPVGFLRRSSKWHRHLNAEDGDGHRLWEVAVLFHLRDAFRSGDIWVPHSRRYSDLKQALVPAEAVKDMPRLAVPLDPEAWLADRKARMTEGLTRLAKAARDGAIPGGSIENGILKLDRLSGGRVRLSAKSPFKALIGGNSSISRKRSVNRGA